MKVPSLDDIVKSFLIKRFSSKVCLRRARALHITHLREIEKLVYQRQIAAKTGMASVLYMKQALIVLLEELKEDNANLDLATQTTRDIFAMSIKTLDQLGRTGAYDHVIRRKAAIIDVGLENFKDVAKQAELLPLTSDGVLGLGFQSKLKDC